MPEFRVIWTKKSRSDLQNIYDFSSNLSHQYAMKLLKRILNREYHLRSFPKSGRLQILANSETKEYRFIVEGNYKIIYSILEKEVVVARVFDTRQNPDRLKL